MHELPRDLVTILLTEARNQRKPPVDYVVAEDGGRKVCRPEPNIAMAELLEEAAAALAAREPAIPDDFVEALVESYAFYADDGRTHTPEDNEREMLVDFGHNLIAEYVAHIDAGHAPAARSGGLKPLDENDYEDIVNAATTQMRMAKFRARGQMITVQDGLDWWIMKETERRVLAAIEAADPAPTAKPVAWLHEMKEPDSKSSILSRSPENPFGHWLEKYREQCTYSVTPLYARTSPSKRADVAGEGFPAK